MDRLNALTAPSCADPDELLERLKSGDDAAFEDLVRRASGRMLAVARRLLRSEDDAQDAVQDAFLSAFKSLAAFDGRSQLTTWLHRITVNACLMKLRSARRRPERAIESFLPEFLPDGHPRRPAGEWKRSASSDLEEAELLALVRPKIDELPEEYRQVILLRDIEELSTEETAAALGLTIPAVKTRLHRARQALRSLLDPLLSEDCR